MSITGKIAECAALLKGAVTLRATAQASYNTIKSLNGQSGYSLTIGGVSVPVAVMDSRTYQAKLIRGREMIHLGALKAMTYEIDNQDRRIKELRAELSRLGAELSEAAAQ
ncbi:MAG: hypothetical protein K2X80_08505 [Pseudomonadaceae bacterium]|nr:hypothetical protein [Pseudomonadaceae bacterium]